MKEHRIILLLFIQLVALRVTAQWSVGLSGGYAFNYYNYDPQYMSGLHYKGHHGFAVDVPVNYQFNDWFSLSTGLSYQQKGYVLDGSYIPQDQTNPCYFYKDLKRNDSYFVLPLFSEFAFGNSRWKALIDLGLYSGFWSSSVFVYKEIQGIGHYSMSDYVRQCRTFEEKADRQIEFGLIGGLGVKRDFGKHWSLTATARCYYSVTPQQKDYQIMHFPSRNTTFTAQIGIFYYFKAQNNE